MTWQLPWQMVLQRPDTQRMSFARYSVSKVGGGEGYIGAPGFFPAASISSSGKLQEPG